MDPLFTERLESARTIVRDALARHPGRIALACSFGGPTGMVVLDLVHPLAPETPVYYLDTGVLFPETYELIERVSARYGIEPVAVKSDLSLQAQAAAFGDRLWERDPDRCCEIRKVEPNEAFLRGFDAWFTGLRQDQSESRAAISAVQDDGSGREKIAPLFDWTERDVWSYVLERKLDYNPLNDRGYPSVGCTYCTRAIGADEQARDGRWSGFNKVECGLHTRRKSA